MGVRGHTHLVEIIASYNVCFCERFTGVGLTRWCNSRPPACMKVAVEVISYRIRIAGATSLSSRAATSLRRGGARSKRECATQVVVFERAPNATYLALSCPGAASNFAPSGGNGGHLLEDAFRILNAQAKVLGAR